MAKNFKQNEAPALIKPARAAPELIADLLHLSLGKAVPTFTGAGSVTHRLQGLISRVRTVWVRTIATLKGPMMTGMKAQHRPLRPVWKLTVC